MKDGSFGNLMQTFAMVREAFLALGPLQRAGVGAIGLATAGLLGVLLLGDFGGGHKPIAKDLPDAAATKALMARLLAAGLTPRLTDSGRTVEVRDSEFAAAAKLATERDVLPKRQVSMMAELARKNSMLLSGEERRLVGLRALEARVEESLETYDMVQSAKVSLSLPSENGFARERGAAKASVILVLKADVKAGRSLLRTIRATISHAVDGLSSENISISDSHGTDLAFATEEGEGSERSSIDGLPGAVEQAERDATRKVISLLRPLFGEENLSVTVTAKLNPASDLPAPIKRNRVAATARTASLGSASDSPASEAPTTSLEPSTPFAGATIAWLGVSVLINSNSFPGGQLPESLRKSAEAAVLTAVGEGPGKSDRVTVVGAPFRQAAAKGSAVVAIPMLGDLLAPWASGIWIGGTGFLVVMLLGVLQFSFPRPSTAETMTEEVPSRNSSRETGDLSIFLGLTPDEVRLLLHGEERRDLAVVLAASRSPLRDFVMDLVPSDERELLGAQVAFMPNLTPDEVTHSSQRIFDKLHPRNLNQHP